MADLWSWEWPGTLASGPSAVKWRTNSLRADRHHPKGDGSLPRRLWYCPREVHLDSIEASAAAEDKHKPQP